jgi:exonuclease SbcC
MKLALATGEEARLNEMTSVLAKIGIGLEEWGRGESVRRQESLLVAEAGATSLEEHGLALANVRLAAEQSLRAARAAHDASEKLTAAVKDVGESFGSDAIAPFSELFRSFLRALVRDTRYHDVRPEYGRTRGGGNILRFNLELGGVESSASSEFQVELVLSEGQLSEVSLAAMLAASCTYPWSRWRALLLDDPTQYQDLTHSTSLFEVIRNLATNGGFQVIVAVHDRAQADFLIRKLVSARVPHVECEYVALGPQGAVTQIRQFLGDPGSITS